MSDNHDHRYFFYDHEIENNLPKNWKYKVVSRISFGEVLKKLELTLKVALFTKEEIQLWVRSLEEQTGCTYSVHRNNSCKGKIIKYKLYLRCQHNTRCDRTYDQSVKNRTKNMNCPSRLNITLKAINKKFRGKSENAADPEMPCVIEYIATHNHNIDSADAYRFRRVSEETKEKLINLFKLGHSPATALETIKIEIQLSTDSYEKLLADRSICPDYNYCYRIFKQEFKARYGSIDFSDDGKRFLVENLEEYNNTVGEEPDNADGEFSGFIADPNTNDSTELKSAVEEGYNIFNEISEHITSFVNQSPLEMLPALRKMLERTKKIKTVNACVSSCTTFGSDIHRKNLVARRKTNVTGKTSHVGGRLRQGSKIKKKCHIKLQNLIIN